MNNQEQTPGTVDDNNDDGGFGERSLLPDCWNLVFSFLTLKECLEHSHVSKASMKAISKEIGRRRNKSFFTRHGYHAKLSLSIVNETASKVGFVQPTLIPIESASTRHEAANDWRVLPILQHRVNDLFRAVPSVHPMMPKIKELKLHLENGRLMVEDCAAAENGPNEDEIMATTEEQSFALALSKLRAACKAYRLHSLILSRAIDSNPIHDFDSLDGRRPGLTRPLQSASALTVSMEQYWGDVLIAYFLMGHNVSGLVEGGRSEEEWTRQLRVQFGLGQSPDSELTTDASPSEDSQTLESTTAIASLNTVYRAFVYLHSASMRALPFSVEQVASLKLGNAGYPCSRQGCDFLQPHLPFSGTYSIIRNILPSIGVVLRDHSLRAVMHQFGPLGPSFRGRDHVRSAILNGQTFCTKLSVLLYLAQLDSQESLPSNGPFLNLWLGNSTSDVDRDVSWMLEVAKVCSQSRPMTVAPPLVVFEQVN